MTAIKITRTICATIHKIKLKVEWPKFDNIYYFSCVNWD